MAQIFSPSGEWVPYDFEQLTVGAAAVPPTAAKIAVNDPANPGVARRARAAFLTVEGNAIRVRMDGAAPTAAVGHLLSPGDMLLVEGVESVKRLKMIRQGAADGTVNITYYRTA